MRAKTASALRQLHGAIIRQSFRDLRWLNALAFDPRGNNLHFIRSPREGGTGEQRAFQMFVEPKAFPPLLTAAMLGLADRKQGRPSITCIDERTPNRRDGLIKFTFTLPHSDPQV